MLSKSLKDIKKKSWILLKNSTENTENLSKLFKYARSSVIHATILDKNDDYILYESDIVSLKDINGSKELLKSLICFMSEGREVLNTEFTKEKVVEIVKSFANKGFNPIQVFKVEKDFCKIFEYGVDLCSKNYIKIPY